MRAALAVFAAASLAFVGVRSADVADARVDTVFECWNSPSTPGCAVGAAVAGTPVLAKAYGMADLEHDVKITPDTIFEAGSVSKQFTAAAVLLLARERQAVLRLHARAAVRAAGHDAHVMARRPHTRAQEPRDRVFGTAEPVSHQHALRGRLRQRRTADDGRRPPDME